MQGLTHVGLIAGNTRTGLFEVAVDARQHPLAAHEASESTEQKGVPHQGVCQVIRECDQKMRCTSPIKTADDHLWASAMLGHAAN